MRHGADHAADGRRILKRTRAADATQAEPAQRRFLFFRLAGGASDREAVAELLAAPDDDPDDLTALDAAWEETEVSFGPDPNAGCPVSREQLARMNGTVPPAPGQAAE